ncbi:MAG: DUF302 domain-containing protein [Egibacteraceae bacterium]
MSYGNHIRVDLPVDEAVERVKAVFQTHGFGTLTEIDVQATLAEKLGEDMEPYTILGVCNPQLAHQALGVDRSIGLLLPCTVVVRGGEDGTIVEALDPQVMVTIPDRDALQPVADAAAERIDAALAELAG